MPKPVGYRVCIEVKPMENKTKGGIYLADSTINSAQQATDTGTVVAIGEGCFKGRLDIGQPWYKVGDTVYFVRYAGQKIELADGRLYRMMNDEDVWGLVEDGEELASDTYVR